MSHLKERLRSTVHDADAARVHQQAQATRFKIASFAAVRHGLLNEDDKDAICIALEVLRSGSLPLARSPLFEWSTEMIAEAARTETGLPPGFSSALQEAMNRAAISDPVMIPASTALHPYAQILDGVVARQDIPTRDIRSEIRTEQYVLDEIERSVSTVNALVPDSLVDVSCFANTIIPFTHPDISGTSVAGATGLVFVRVENRLIDTMDHIIHEWAHNKFDLILNEYPLWGDDGQLYRSPIRDDLRPIYGVFHANYVLLTVSEAMAHISCTKDNELSDAAKEKTAEFLDECEISIGGLAANSNLTDCGKQFVDICASWLSAIRGYRA